MAIRTFRAIAGSVSIVLDNGSMLFSKSLDKNTIDLLYKCANGFEELSDEDITSLIEGDNFVKMTKNEQEIIVQRETTKDIIRNGDKYPNIFECIDGAFYRKGISLSIPTMVLNKYFKVLESYSEDSVEFLSLDNFWMWTSLNPNKYAREELLGFLGCGDFDLTPNGYFVAYRGLVTKEKGDQELTNIIASSYAKVKGWKKSPANYLITKVDDQYKLEKITASEPEGTMVGNLRELYQHLGNIEGTTTYTDAHTGRMTIKLGKEVRIPRKQCDEDSRKDCSNGLHLGNKTFGFSSFGDTVVVCLCNPMNVVAVPQYNKNKLRTCAYFPMAIAEKRDGQFVKLEYSAFDDVYFDHQINELDRLAKENNPEEVEINKVCSLDFSNIVGNLENISAIVRKRIEEV